MNSWNYTHQEARKLALRYIQELEAEARNLRLALTYSPCSVQDLLSMIQTAGMNQQGAGEFYADKAMSLEEDYLLSASPDDTFLLEAAGEEQVDAGACACAFSGMGGE